MAEPRQDRAPRQERSGGERPSGNGGASRPAPRPEAPRPQMQQARPDMARPQAPERPQAQSAWRGNDQRQQQARPVPQQQGDRSWSNARPPQQGQQRPDQQPNWKSGNRWQGNGTPSAWQRAKGNIDRGDADRRDDDRRWNAGNGRDRPDGRPDGRPGTRPGNDRPDDRPAWNGKDNRPDRNAWGKDRRDNDRRWSNGDNHRWDRDNWRRDNRYDWQRYRDRNRSAYHIGGYYAPYRGYSYRRLSIGFTLGSMFYGSNYWLDDPWSYRLPPVYGPYRWVRYYDDVLLVDTYSGEVVDVIYDFFW
ncbi:MULTISPECIES: RcnB family protein [unclassified Novosphingobium]|nr:MULTISPECIES: RcnB family protein [unclassified Novosphingobium]WRT91543.1 RcnB family protein [Novosphingobium sp. RL4]